MRSVLIAALALAGVWLAAGCGEHDTVIGRQIWPTRRPPPAPPPADAASGAGGEPLGEVVAGAGGAAGVAGGAPSAAGGSAGVGGGEPLPECTPSAPACVGNVATECTADGRLVEIACDGATPWCRDGSCQAVVSCSALTVGCAAGTTCCALDPLPSGSFDRKQTDVYPATLSARLVDRYEVTVGRFRAFVEAYPESRPTIGAGAHPALGLTSGWQSAWDAELPSTAGELRAALACAPGYATFTEQPGAQETFPQNCLTFYEAFAFCAWDGGRLLTEAEHNYLAAGGDEQRTYPWGDRDPGGDIALAVYGCHATGTGICTGLVDLPPVGSAPAGGGRFGQLDLVGSLAEWNLDLAGLYPNPCIDCANLSSGETERVHSGGAFDGPVWSTPVAQTAALPGARAPNLGARCARDR